MYFVKYENLLKFYSYPSISVGRKVVVFHGNLFLCVAICLFKSDLYVGTCSIGSLVLVSELPIQ